MNDDKTCLKLEAERDTLVDEHFIGEPEIQLRRSIPFKLGEIRRKKGISIFHPSYKGIKAESLDDYYARMRLINK